MQSIRPVFKAVVFSCTLLLSSLAPAGTIGVRPEFDPGAEIRDAVKVRYHLRVNELTADTLKIIFQSRRVYNPACQGTCQTYLLESNLYSYWVEYADTGCVPWPPTNAGPAHFGQAGLWLSIPDYNLRGMIGSRPANAATRALFPRVMSGIDNIPRLSKIETMSQRNLAGQDIVIEYARGATFSAPLSGWGSRFDPDAPLTPSGQPPCMADLPGGVIYRIWTSSVSIAGQTYTYEFAVPDAYGTHFTPEGMFDIVTEFLDRSSAEIAAGKGSFQTFFWDIEVQREDSTNWIPLRRMKVFYRADPTDNIGWGAKVGRHAGRYVLEVSNDLSDSYFKLNEVFQLPASPSMYLRGSFNGWGNRAMDWDARGGFWTTRVDLAANAQFKFDTYGDWRQNWGDNNPGDGRSLAELNGSNIAVGNGGSYQIRFNEQTLSYSATRLDPSLQRTVVFMYGPTTFGQNMFLLGGIDWTYASSSLGRDCAQNRWLCAMPIQHTILTSDPNRTNDHFLDWHGAETGQSATSPGSPMVWTSNNRDDPHVLAIHGYGYDPENRWGPHHWKLDVQMDCSSTVNGWFELKSLISNGPGLEVLAAPQVGRPYTGKVNNHFARCGMLNRFERGSNMALIEPLP